MITFEQIQEYADRIVKEFDPERIILFGSYANGTPRIDSDVDMLVVMPFTGNSVSKSVAILRRTSPKFAVDLLVRKPEVLKKRIADGDLFMREVMETGTPIYEKANG
ncbi:MAG TPA: nucleotidyltransferase domain-containing protein [Candidatus Kapabacteria bacterium]|nr:nucleotidyltransferase domain-containing protein [Candidatus Kapabacteria bacterium]